MTAIDPQQDERVVREHRDRVVVHCYQLLGSFHEAEEAAQEVFLRAWQGRAGSRGEFSTRTWLLTIATRASAWPSSRPCSPCLPGSAPC